MTKTVAVAAFAFATVLGSLPSLALAETASVPCEQKLSAVNAAMKATKAADSEKATAVELKGKGLERCKADDDAGADAFFDQALQVLGK
ncbi:hypothetical protein [Aminobacter sp. AP02]|uniref:hypothetical protein n=1 Tax=Aminobacter sp. AP02 TaxID=2135737 RepID=UPI000D7AD6A9|nr:hypothetical protein [Aminobacter sp. AP02]PWK59443.1 hypothetical protein C8K44_1444 [Aminobacter sp. AP02]